MSRKTKHTDNPSLRAESIADRACDMREPDFEKKWLKVYHRALAEFVSFEENDNE